MTRIVDGYAQPDIQATKNGREIIVFVEDALSILDNEDAIIQCIQEIIRTRLSSIEKIEIIVQ